MLSVAVALGALALPGIHRLGGAIRETLHRNYVSIEAAQHMHKALWSLQLAQHQGNIDQVLKPSWDSFKYWIDVEQGDITEVGEAALAHDIEQRGNKLFGAFAARVTDSSIDQDFAALHTRLDDLIALNSHAMFRADGRASRMGNRLTWEFACGLAALLLIGIALSWTLAATITQPLNELADRLRSFSLRGNLLKLREQPLAELQTVASEFNKMAERLEQFEKLNVDRLVYEKSKTEAIIESIEDGIVLIGPKGIVTHINEIAAIILGVEREDALGSPFDDLNSHHPHYLRIRNALQRAFSGDDTHRIEVELHVRGRDHSYLLKPVPLRQAGQRFGTILTLQDITYLRDLDRARTNLVATLSHELKTPLTSISLSAGLLERRWAEMGEQEGRLVAGIGEDVARIRHLADDLLNLARGTNANIAVRSVELNLVELIRAVSRAFTVQAEHKQVILRLELPDNLPALRGDPIKLSWVVSKLISNALRYTPEGGTIAVVLTQSSGAFSLKVRDTGSGIPAEIKDRLFERFAQGKVNGAEPGSAGLGLAIVKDIVEAHGGRIFVATTEGYGTCFTVGDTHPAGGFMARLLIVDDEKNIRNHLGTFFETCGHRVRTAESAAEALSLLGENGGFDLVLSDYRMAEINGLALLQRIKRDHPSLPVILMTAYGTVESAVEAMKSGAYDYVTKPFTLDQIQHVVARALEVQSLRAEVSSLRDAIDDQPLLESRSPAMRHLLEVAYQAASSEATILLMGESGTGKNVLARQIHKWSRRFKGPFVVVNCTTLSENLLESELFGHMRGSFTGAFKDKPGRLEAANHGTVFLDEVADLSAPLQTKFLRFVQEQCFERVGGDETIHVDTRIIAASNRDLLGEVRAHHFREDLFYRLNVIALQVPSLRKRREDVLALAEHFLATAATRNHRPGLRFSPEAEGAIKHYWWPGNIRELRNAVERAAILALGEVIKPDCLPDAMFREQPEPLPSSFSPTSLEEVERQHIERVLAETATLEEAAAILGINTSTLWRKRKRYKFE